MMHLLKLPSVGLAAVTSIRQFPVQRSASGEARYCDARVPQNKFSESASRRIGLGRLSATSYEHDLVRAREARKSIARS
jgi:hypothetical protein